MPEELVAALGAAFGAPVRHAQFVCWPLGAALASGLRPLRLCVPLVRRGGVCEAWLFTRGKRRAAPVRIDVASSDDVASVIASAHLAAGD
jgi:hypothetical protein